YLKFPQEKQCYASNAMQYCQFCAKTKTLHSLGVRASRSPARPKVPLRRSNDRLPSKSYHGHRCRFSSLADLSGRAFLRMNASLAIDVFKKKRLGKIVALDEFDTRNGLKISEFLVRLHTLGHDGHVQRTPERADGTQDALIGRPQVQSGDQGTVDLDLVRRD